MGTSACMHALLKIVGYFAQSVLAVYHQGVMHDHDDNCKFDSTFSLPTSALAIAFYHCTTE